MSTHGARPGGETRRPAAFAILSILLLAVALSGCQVDQMRIRFNEAEQGTVTATVSGEIPEANRANYKSSLIYRRLNAIGEQLTTACNVRHLLYGRENRAQLDLRAAFSDVDQLNSLLSCGALQYREPSAEFERHDGFFWDTFIVRFAISLDSRRCEASETCEPPGFPRLLLLTVPGKIRAINGDSRLVGMTEAHRKLDDNTVRIAVTPVADYRAANAGYFSGRRDNVRRDALRFEIVSRRANFDLNTIISVIGVIFGSGFLIQLSRMFLFPKPEDKPRRARSRRARSAPSGEPDAG